jgi:hypothetical protein
MAGEGLKRDEGVLLQDARLWRGRKSQILCARDKDSR